MRTCCFRVLQTCEYSHKTMPKCSMRLLPTSLSRFCTMHTCDTCGKMNDLAHKHQTECLECLQRDDDEDVATSSTGPSPPEENDVSFVEEAQERKFFEPISFTNTFRSQKEWKKENSMFKYEPTMKLNKGLVGGFHPSLPPRPCDPDVAINIESAFRRQDAYELMSQMSKTISTSPFEIRPGQDVRVPPMTVIAVEDQRTTIKSRRCAWYQWMASLVTASLAG